ncbi:hypothetical protein GH714_017175 [Hevea brasiliensis]|uniref:Uncharacterized protein n=1 Tax=Hevea brasiliensis TaxID=3981 RepID=A0A6A6KC84_HEVBR|nr:hypothetical protein GH714_017175 [Hevea brasiliensis]
MAGHCSSNKVSPNPCGPNGSGDIPSRQRHANPPSIQRVSSAQPSSMPLQYSSKKVSPAQKRSFHDYGVDENVDMKTASYISYVRESFKVEKVDSEA